MSAYEDGFDLFKRKPELVLAAVAWLGPKDKADALEFLEGYKAARRQHDDFKREQTEQKKEGGRVPSPSLG